MSWQLPPPPPPLRKRRGWSGVDPDDTADATCCCLASLPWEIFTCCWWPLLALAGLAAAVVLWPG